MFTANATRFCSRLIQGLEFLHIKCKVIHRDIKAANLFLKESGEVLCEASCCAACCAGKCYTSRCCATRARNNPSATNTPLSINTGPATYQ